MASQDNPISSIQKNKLTRHATIAAVATAIFLAVIKLGAWLATGSIAILASLVDSVMDLFSSSVTFAAVRHAQQPADHEHRFGHGKAEPLAALAQSGFTLASGIYLLIEVTGRFLNPEIVEESRLGIAIMIISIIATLILVTFQKYVAGKTNSVAIKADSLHYKGDLLANAGVILALALTEYFGVHWLDPLFGLIIALYILKAAWDVFMESYDMLMDKELPDDEREKIQNIALQFPDVLGVHDLRTRQSGPNCFIQMHLDMNGSLSLNRSHSTADAVENEIMIAFPDSEVMVHQDPVTPMSLPEAKIDEPAHTAKRPPLKEKKSEDE